MKHDFPKVGLERLCRLFGKSRGAIYDHQRRRSTERLEDDIILQHVHQIRQTLPRLGTRKLHFKLEPLLKEHGIQIGRDYLFALLTDHKLLIRRRKRKVITTNSRHWLHKYTNLTGELVVNRPEQLWVSDITYIRLVNQWGYLSLITDAYSHKIMGFCFRPDLSAQGCVDALQMALRGRDYPDNALIHHSDRGTQYCCSAYVGLLINHAIGISMTQNGDPRENAVAERVNGIIKEEFSLYESRLGWNATYERIKSSLRAYNEERPHDSCDRLTPEQAHQRQGVLKKWWKTYDRKKTFEPSENSKKEAATAPLKELVTDSFLR
jgi:transposase InsO family protein